jgi:hypothetical protein
MDPISRTQLNNARRAVLAEKERLAVRQQELKGQLAAEELYKEVRRVAESGEATYAESKHMSPGIAYDTMLYWTKEHFPDCDISSVYYSGPLWAVRVDWTPVSESEALANRRHEKETSW